MQKNANGDTDGLLSAPFRRITAGAKDADYSSAPSFSCAALRPASLDVAEFCRENVHFSWTEFEGNDSIALESLLVTFGSYDDQRWFLRKSAFES